MLLNPDEEKPTVRARGRTDVLESSCRCPMATPLPQNGSCGRNQTVRYSHRMPRDAEQERLTVAGREVAISNPGKVLFPQAGYTKLDLARYYTAVAEGALRGAGGRPNVLVRYPNGIGGEFFFQKRAPQARPPWIEVVTLRFPSGRTAEEVVPRDAAALVWMANLACLELHPHPVRTDDLDHPDELRVDLNPVPGVTWAQIQEVAGVVRATLADVGLVGWPKTSGSRGVHIYVRIERRWTFDEVRPAALALAREVERRAPQLATSKWWKEERHGVFIDYNQNAKDRTIASAYSGQADTGCSSVRSPHLGRDRRVRPGRLYAGDDAGPPRPVRRPSRRHRQSRRLVARVAGTLGPSSGRGSRRRAMAASLPETARRGSARRTITPPDAEPSAHRGRTRAGESGRARRPRALEGASSRGRRAPDARGRARGCVEGPLSNVDASAGEPAARTGGSSADTGTARS